MQEKVLKVMINLREVAVVHSDKEAWKIIGDAPFGALYEVHDENDCIVTRFIPY